MEEGKIRLFQKINKLTFFMQFLEEICRVCRSEGTVEEPLFHPCKCSGSIRFVHQEWYL